ncbi:hypothetical protein H4582DRAFT_1947447 [Lactarius indigo]|nr:hypothetical protein H4582DRAFT_1947447 [Lactarius indigo]
MAARLLELEGEHNEVVPSTTVGERSVISDAAVDVVLDPCEVSEGCGIDWKSGAAAAKGSVNKGTAGFPRCMWCYRTRAMMHLRICLETTPLVAVIVRASFRSGILGCQ